MAGFKLLLALYFLLPEITTFSIRTNNDCPGECHCFRNVDSWEADCSRGNFQKLPNFSNMGIEIVDLSRNLILNFPRELSQLRLTHLNLAYNHINYIQDDDLIGFDALVSLDLSNNNISSWINMNPNVAFQNAIHLKYLYLTGNLLYTLTDDNPKDMIYSSSLNELYLEDCAIHSVKTTLIDQALPNLHFISLSRNNLKNDIWLVLLQLKKLDISNSNIKRIKSAFFQGVPNLETLNVSRNLGIQLGDNNNEKISESLIALDISFCSLDDLHIIGFPYLEDLKFRNNMLRTLHAKHFVDTAQLRILDLSNNHINDIGQKTFTITEHLNYLDLSFNSLNTLNEKAFDGNKLLLSLNLSHNEFQKIPLLISDSLEILDFSYCRIQSINQKFFTNLKAIENLNLKGNELRDFPSDMSSMTLTRLDVSQNRIDKIRNTSFLGFPKLTNLKLNQNSLTSPSFKPLLGSLLFLKNVWLGNNPYECECYLHTESLKFMDDKAKIFRDQRNIYCSYPLEHFGQTFQEACSREIAMSSRSTKAENVWTAIIFCLLVGGGMICLCGFCQRFLKSRRKRRNERELERNNAEMNEIRRLNARILREGNGSSNAPRAYDLTALPSYEDALRMPKLERPTKSMVDLTCTDRNRNKFKRSATEPEGNASDAEEELLVDKKCRFHSVEMLSNRDKERTAYIMPNRRCDVSVNSRTYNHQQLSIEASKFPSSFLKSQNLQSAERIGNFQSYENSPYCKRRQKIAEIPPFKRATLMANSVEFLTDPEFDAHSKPSSPFARRKPKLAIAKEVISKSLAPAIEDHFGTSQLPISSSSDESDFQIVMQPELSKSNSQRKNYDSSSEGDKSETYLSLEQGKRKKRRNSSGRRTSVNFSSNNLPNASTTSSSTENLMEIIPKPNRETKF